MAASALRFRLVLALFTLPVLAHGQIVTDGSFGAAQTLTGPAYDIGAALGRQAGANLFHSLSQFNLRAGESATFSGPTRIGNIITRITGGQGSSIDGAVRSSIDGASLFLINPSGLLIGPNASFDVSGSLHLSTANELRFADGSRLSMGAAGAPTLSLAPVEAFGFTTATPSPINLNGVGGILRPNTGTVPLGLAPGESADLTITAGSIAIDVGRSPIVDAPYTQISSLGGRIALTAVGSSGEVPVEPWQTPSVAPTGSIHVDAAASIRQLGGDGIIIRGGRIEMSGESQITTSGTNFLPAGPIDIYARDFRLQESASVVGGANGGMNSDDITIFGSDRILLRNGGPGENITQRFFRGLANSSAVGSNGAAGEIFIAAPIVDIGGESASISTTSFGNGDSGDVTIIGGTEILISNLNLATIATGSGEAGRVTIQSPRIVIADSQFYSGAGVDFLPAFVDVIGRGSFTEVSGVDVTISNSVFNSASNNAGQAGDLAITAQRLNISNSRLTSAANQTGAGGKIGVLASESAVLENSTISAASIKIGDGGDIIVVSPSIRLRGTLITTATRLDANAGHIILDSVNLVLENSFVTSDAGEVNPQTGVRTESSGVGGRIGLWATDSLTMRDSGATSRTAGRGSGNLVWLDAPDIVLSGSSISADTFGEGDAGSIIIDGGTLRMINSSATGSNSAIIIDGKLVDSSASGAAGSVTVDLSGDLTISGPNSGLGSVTVGSGSGGNVDVFARNVILTDGAAISTDSSGQGTAGEVYVDVQQSVTLRDASITTQSLQTDGGNIDIFAIDRLLLQGGGISTSVAGTGNGGNIYVDPRFILLQGGSQIIARAVGGDGGNIDLFIVGNGAFVTSIDSSVSASSDLGVDGSVQISAPEQDVQGALSSLEARFQDPGALARKPCADRLRASQGRFVIVGARQIGAFSGKRLSAGRDNAASTETRQANAAPRKTKVVATEATKLVGLRITNCLSR